MDLKEIPVGALRANDYNFNEMSEGALKNLAAEVKRRGFIMHHIVARQDGDAFVIVDGEHQWRAAQAAGLETVPVQVVEASAAEAIAETYRRNGLRGEANRVKLARAVRRMQAEGVDEAGVPLSNVKAAKALGRTEAWLRTTLQYAELADLAGRQDFPSEEAVAKLTEQQVKEWLAFAKGTGPNPNGAAVGGTEPGAGEGAGAGAGAGAAEGKEPDSDEDKAAKALTGVIKKLAKMTVEERAHVVAAIKRIDKEAKKKAEADGAADNPALPL